MFPQPGATLSADRPEGNGTGIVWDDAGHIVTNYHVLGGALRNVRPGQNQAAPRVARVTLLGANLNQVTTTVDASTAVTQGVDCIEQQAAMHLKCDSEPPCVCGAGRDGYQQTFDATLVGADRTKDLAVIHISAPKVLLQLCSAWSTLQGVGCCRSCCCWVNLIRSSLCDRKHGWLQPRALRAGATTTSGAGEQRQPQSGSAGPSHR